MVALWLAAAAVLLPPRRSSAGPRTRSPPAGWPPGPPLLLAAVLVKPTAVLHGAPLVLGWFLVDRRSAWRLVAALAASGLAALGRCSCATGGGFLWATPPLGPAPRRPSRARRSCRSCASARSVWPILVLALGRLRRGRPRRGASPARAGAAAAGRGAGRRAPPWASTAPRGTTSSPSRGPGRGDRLVVGAAARRPGRGAGAAVATPAVGALVASCSRRPGVFPLPTAARRGDRPAPSTASRSDVSRGGRAARFLVEPARPRLLPRQAARRDRGLELPHAGPPAPPAPSASRPASSAPYSLVVGTWPLAPRPLAEARQTGYRYVGACRLGFYFGPVLTRVYVRRDLPFTLPASQGARCGPTSPGRSLNLEPPP